METVLYLIVLLPLAAALLAGLGGRWIGRAGAHWVTILAVAGSFGLSLWVLYGLLWGGLAPIETTAYTWAAVGELRLEAGFLVDRLTALSEEAGAYVV